MSEGYKGWTAERRHSLEANWLATRYLLVLIVFSLAIWTLVDACHEGPLGEQHERRKDDDMSNRETLRIGNGDADDPNFP